MKINHKLIRETIKWFTFALFAISVAFKVKAIIEHGGVKPIKDPNESIPDDTVPVEDYDGDGDDDEDYSEYAEEESEVYEKESPAIACESIGIAHG